MRRRLPGGGRRNIAGARQKPSRITGYYRNNGRSGGSCRAFNDVLLRPRQFTYDQSVMASGLCIYRGLSCWTHRLFTGIQNGASTFRLVLIGIGFSMSAQAMTTLLMIKGPIYRASQANVYITGSVYGSNWRHVKIAVILSVILLFICFIALKI